MTLTSKRVVSAAVGLGVWAMVAAGCAAHLSPSESLAEDCKGVRVSMCYPRAASVVEARTATDAQRREALDVINQSCRSDKMAPACEYLHAYFRGPVAVGLGTDWGVTADDLDPELPAQVTTRCLLTSSGELESCEPGPAFQALPAELQQRLKGAIASRRFKPATFYGHPVSMPYEVVVPLHPAEAHTP